MATFSLPVPTELVFYEKPGCLSNARQKARLLALGHCLEIRNLLIEVWTAQRLRPFFGNRPVAEWFNPSAPRIRTGEVRPELLSEAEALDLMVAEPILIRRPLMEIGGACLCGFERGPLLGALGVELGEGEDLQACSRGGIDPVCPAVPSLLSSVSRGQAPAEGVSTAVCPAVARGWAWDGRPSHSRSLSHRLFNQSLHSFELESHRMPKAKVTFADIEQTVNVPAGIRVIDISEKIGAGIIYGCREGDCGTCMMHVTEGWNNLTEPSVLEEKVLRENMANRHYRLACQAQVLGDCTIKPA